MLLFENPSFFKKMTGFKRLPIVDFLDLKPDPKKNITSFWVTVLQ